MSSPPSTSALLHLLLCLSSSRCRRPKRIPSPSDSWTAEPRRKTCKFLVGLLQAEGKHRNSKLQFSCPVYSFRAKIGIASSVQQNSIFEESEGRGTRRVHGCLSVCLPRSCCRSRPVSLSVCLSFVSAEFLLLRVASRVYSCVAQQAF